MRSPLQFIEPCATACKPAGNVFVRFCARGRVIPGEETQPPSIHGAMRYSVQAGGKRVRPILCLESARIFSADVTPVLPVACGIEFIHTYSLIHAHLPAP